MAGERTVTEYVVADDLDQPMSVPVGHRPTAEWHLKYWQGELPEKAHRFVVKRRTVTFGPWVDVPAGGEQA